MNNIVPDLKLNHLFFLLFIFICLVNFESFSQNLNIHNTTKSIADEKRKHGSSEDSTRASTKGSIMPVPFIITDMNLGFGGILALPYIHPQKHSKRKNTPTTITGIAGGATSTKSWAVAGLHSESFKNDKVRYMGGALVASVNLDFYNIGKLDLSDRPINVNIKGWGLLQSAMFRIKDSNFFIGGQYGFLDATSSINLNDPDHPLLDSLINQIHFQTYVSGIALKASFDNRENALSPKKGINGGFTLNYNPTWLGASQDFITTDVFFKAYVPFTRWLYSIYHFDGEFSGGDIPFYMKPYVALRGAPVMRYSANNAMLAEIQLRGYFYRNFALVAFTGAGKAFDSFSEFKSSEWIINYGTGFRWEIEKIFGIRTGLDFAWANGEFGWYVVIGTAI